MVEPRPTRGISRVFVGRQREMAELSAALDDVLTGHGRLVMLVGEPGIGKTRTAQELASYAESRGAQVHWGWCYEEEGAPPYWPWLQSIGSYIQHCDPGQLSSELSLDAAHIAEMLPVIGVKLPGLPVPPPLEPEQARFRLFSSIANFLKSASQTQPLVMVLDDLQWADHASLLFLEFLARAMPDSHLMLVGTYRNVEVSRQHRLSQTVGRLMREQLFRRVQLRGLTQQEVNDFSELSTGVALPDDTLEVVYRRTEGNPLFVGEMVRLFSQGELGTEPGWSGGVPEGIRDAIGGRLNRLSKECIQVLTTAAVVGRQFELKLLGVLSGEFSEDRLLVLLDEALASRVIEELPDAVGRYQFNHALIQETLNAELSSTRRVRLHASIAVALEGLYGDDAESHAAELAHHFAQAEAFVGTEKLVHYSLVAGERALAAYAWEEAQMQFERGLAAKGVLNFGEDPIPDPQGANLLFGFGRARAGTAHKYQLQEAADILTRAFDYYMENGNVATAVAVASYPVPIGGVRTGMARIIRSALLSVPPNSLEAGRLQASLGFEAGRVEANYDEAATAFAQALNIAGREGDASLEMSALAWSAEVDFFHLKPDQSLTTSLEVIELARRASNTHVEAQARLTATRVLIAIGEGEKARVQTSALLELGEKLRDRYWLGCGLGMSSDLASLRGEWQASRELGERALALAPDDPIPLSRMAMLEYDVGNFGQGQHYLERLLEVMALSPPGPRGAFFFPSLIIGLAARITGQGDRFDVAADAAKIVLSSPSGPPLYPLFARGGLAIQAVVSGNAESAREQYAAIVPERAGIMIGHLIAVNRLLGLLAHTMSDLDEAVNHFEDALVFCRKAGYRPELAWTCSDYAECLIDRKGAGDLAKAEYSLDEAHMISSDLGMRPLMERVLETVDQLRLRSTGAPGYPDGLSPREVEVLALICIGKSNREIGEELVISLSTVAHHVSNIFNKTGVANRAEAATYAARHELAPK